MKIAIMAAWNTTSGVAMHAEPVGKALKKMGHDLIVFTFDSSDHHGEGITAKDEKYVTRCFGTMNHSNALDPRPFLQKDFDILLVEDLGMLPVEKLANIIPVIKRKAKIIHAVHENKVCEHSWFYKIDWDQVVYFDHRQDFLKKIYPDAEYIPFPCFPKRKGSKEAARKRLRLPLDKRIVYTFGHRGYHSYYRNLPRELKKKTILLHVIQKDTQMLEDLTPKDWRIVKRHDVLSTKKFDDYLFASDAVILHKFQSRFHAVVSSTVYQALGAGCPIVVPSQSDFFHDWKKELIHYHDTAALNKKLIKLFGRNGKKEQEQREKAVDKFVKEHSPEKVAKQFEGIFERLLDKK